jgi:hypothetical protein
MDVPLPLAVHKRCGSIGGVNFVGVEVAVRNSAAGYDPRLDPMESVVMSILVELEKEIEELRKKVEELEERRRSSGRFDIPQVVN